MNELTAIRILHLDDDAAYASLMADMLEREDERFTIVTESSATEGLDRLAEDDIDCIVSDYNMPGMDGIDFLEAVREGYPDLPFILCTGKGSEAVASEAISAGVTDYLQKEPGTERFELLANRIDDAVELTRAQRERRRNLDAIETAREGIAIFGDGSEMVYVNEAFADIYGYDREAMVGEHWELIYRDEDVSMVHDEILPTIEANGHWRGETIGVRADGSTFVEDHTLASTDEGELVCTIQDITEDKDRKRELKKKKRRYQAVFHDPNILVGLLDTTGTVLEINETAMEYVDADLAEVTGKPFWETPWFTGDEAIEATIRSRVEQAATGEYVEFEADLSETVADQLVVNGVIRPVTNDDGEVVSLLVSDRDITERKRREQEIELKNRAMDEAPVGIVISDPARDDNPITYANDRFKQLTGYAEEEILGRNCRFLQGEATAPEPVATMRNAIDDREPVTVELRNDRKDGTEFWTRVSVAPVKNDAGDVTHFVGFQEDISERKR